MATTTTTPRVLKADVLSVADAALELRTSQLAVNRLIARRGIKAGRIDGKEVPEFRVDAREMVDYINRGTPDLPFPAMNQSDWFAAEPAGGDARKLVLDMIAAELDAGQLLTDAQVSAWKQSNKRESTLLVDLRLSAGRSLWSTRVSDPLFKTAGEMALAYLFFRRLRLVLDKGPKLASTGGRVAKLYRSPQEYAGYIAATVAELTGERLPFEERRQLTVGQSGSQVTVKYGFQFQTLASGATLSALASRIL